MLRVVVAAWVVINPDHTHTHTHLNESAPLVFSPLVPVQTTCVWRLETENMCSSVLLFRLCGLKSSSCQTGFGLHWTENSGVSAVLAPASTCFFHCSPPDMSSSCFWKRSSHLSSSDRVDTRLRRGQREKECVFGDRRVGG